MNVNPSDTNNLNSLQVDDPRNSINLTSLHVDGDKHTTRVSSRKLTGKEMPSVSKVKVEMESFSKEKALKKLKDVGKITAGVLGTGGLVLLAVPLLVFTVLALLTPEAYDRHQGLPGLYICYGQSYQKIWDWALSKEEEQGVDLP